MESSKISIVVFLLLKLAATEVWCYLNTSKAYVRTPLGGIQGYHKISENSRKYVAFESIPYALPPIGELRFQPPVPMPKWLKDINAIKLPDSCPIYARRSSEGKGDEDCLYLNIYTPAKNESSSLPVIFWIHGGGFNFGTSSNYGPRYIMDRDLILVTINYRLGVFGFLSTGDDVVPGNMGLKDQALALKWISENIKYFGGDPKRITLAGVSAGGASVHYHYLSPMSAGLFRNGISFSGTTFSPWAYSQDNREMTKILASNLNCTTISSLAMIRCLKTLRTETIMETLYNMTKDYYFAYFPFSPVTENVEKDYFINDSPRNIIASGRVYDVPWITGVVSEEGLYITADFALNENLIEYTNKNWERIAPFMLHYENKIPPTKHAVIANMAKQHYFGQRNFSTDLKSVKDLTYLTGDNQIVIGSLRAAKMQSEVNKSPVWYYYYSYRAAQSFSECRSNTTLNLGVSHDDDIYLILENYCMDPTTTENDKKMLQDMLDFWYSIANDGKPNLKTDWPNLGFNSNKFEFMHIAGPGNFTIRNNVDFGELKFWEKIGF